MIKLKRGDLVLSKKGPTFHGDCYVGIVLDYKESQMGFSWSGDKGHYLMLETTGKTSWYSAEYIIAIDTNHRRTQKQKC